MLAGMQPLQVIRSPLAVLDQIKYHRSILDHWTLQGVRAVIYSSSLACCIGNSYRGARLMGIRSYYSSTHRSILTSLPVLTQTFTICFSLHFKDFGCPQGVWDRHHTSCSCIQLSPVTVWTWLSRSHSLPSIPTCRANNSATFLLLCHLFRLACVAPIDLISYLVDDFRFLLSMSHEPHLS